jgi:predicted alpha-1,2-mannosidase
MAAGVALLSVVFAGVPFTVRAAMPASKDPVSDFISFAPVNHRGHAFANRAAAPLLTLTDGRQMEAASTFVRRRRNITAFRAAFTYQATKLGDGSQSGGDGVALVFQNDARGTKAVGGTGNALGYAGIGRSAAFEINLYNGGGQAPVASEGLASGVTSGMLPPGDHQGINVRAAGATGRYDSTGPVNLRSGHPIRFSLRYNGLTLAAKLTDEITGRKFYWKKQIDIPLAVDGDSAYVGFSGASGDATAVQTISDFSFESRTPAPITAQQSPAGQVNVFIGTGAGPGGSINLFPGPSMPFGMVQLSPDTESSGYGYHYYQRYIQGFSMTHMSGPGCNNEGDVFFTATTGAVHTRIKNFQSSYSHAMESGRPGYYQVKLLRWGINAQLTASNRCGLAKFTFPAGKQANILIPISHTLNYTAASKVHIVNNREITGYVVDHCFCGNSQSYTVHFIMTFSKPFAVSGTWSGQKGVGKLHVDSDNVRQTRHNQWVGAYASWPALPHSHSVTVRVGISYLSLAGAESNLRREAAGKSFQTVRRSAWHAWNHALSVIHVSGGLPSQREVFYTALYHSMLMPSIFSDADGKYLGFDNKIHQVAPGHRIYCNYSGWDIYRSEMPLLALIAPKRMEDMCQSIVLMYQQGGWIGRWPQINHYTNVMCGSPLTTVMCMAYLNGLHGFNIHAAWRGMLKDATTAPPPGHPYQGESNIKWINKLHFDPDNYESYGSVSQIQEDCVAYASLYDLAKALGKTRAANMLYQRALYFRNVFDHQDHDFRPRLSNGQWRTPFKPTQSHGFVENSCWQYQWLAPCDMAWLIHAVGTARFNRRLEAFFSYKTPGWMAQYYCPYNEPDLEAPFEFNFSGKPWRTQYVVRRIIRQNYTLSSNGIPGNDDCGEMSSWAVMSMMGLYTIDPAGGAYELCSPAFPKISIRLHAPYTGGRFVITTTAKPAFTPYIQSVKLNGMMCKANWIDIKAITSGGRLSFQLGKTPNRNWGAKPTDAPPSLSESAGQ